MAIAPSTKSALIRTSVALSARVDVTIRRRPLPALCPGCRLKRVLLAVVLLEPDGAPQAETLALCHDCWALRDRMAQSPTAEPTAEELTV